ncbi:sensor histidine kinase [Carboxylicivirga sp. N1Y90]|uniref:sensor histidine kinase n=1 Tax=Carboxylicivirga fragile TaxID=3417571 RepID=UPI003D3591DC|nr:sensor histidine kinase [Marinilabiliaceae bacterium N1Y90]
MLDLSSYDLDNRIYNIRGDVDFYPEVFLSTDQVDQSTHISNLLSISHSWNNQANKASSLPVFTYGTYCFKIKVPSNMVGKTVILKPTSFVAYASELYVNGQLSAFNGRVGKTLSDIDYQPSRNTRVIPVVADSSILEVIVYASNFHHFRGGLFNGIKFGLAEDLQFEQQQNVMSDLAIIISLLIMFLYHFVLYYSNMKEKVSLYFSLTCLIFAIDFSFQDSMTFFLLLPNVSFELSSFMHLTMPYLLPSSFLFFLYAIFPNEVSKLFRNLSAIVSLLLIAFTLILGTRASGFIVKPHYVYIVFIIFYIFKVVIQAVLKKREGANFFLVAYLLFSLCAVNDILNMFELIHTQSLVSTGLVVFVFLLSILQGRRIVVMYNRNKQLSANLKILNVDLEKKVGERTEELNSSLQQLKKLNAYKENLTHMLVHDLKAPLNTVVNADILPEDERTLTVQQSGFHLLNMIQNVLDVYKSENTELNITQEEVSFLLLINDAINEISLSVKMRSILIDLDRVEDYVLSVDRSLIQRVIVNLLSNAVKFSPTGGCIVVSNELQDTGVLKVKISNQGPPIKKSDHEHIFDRFAQSKEGQSKAGSSGLGLTFCRLAIEAHGGEIGVFSERIGAEFWFTIPYVQKSHISKESGQKEILELGLTESEIDYLRPFAVQLKGFKLYDISKIMGLLNTIECSSKAMKEWIQSIENTAYASDIDGYNLHLSLVLK